MSDEKLKKKIENLLFEDPIEEKSAKLLIKNDLTDAMRQWLNSLINRQGTRYRNKPV